MLAFQIVQRLQSVLALQPLDPRPCLAQLSIQCLPDRVGNLARRVIRNSGILGQRIQGVFLPEIP
jgi:hypothetical protein